LGKYTWAHVLKDIRNLLLDHKEGCVLSWPNKDQNHTTVYFFFSSAYM